jgi:hypothetical protein
MLTLRDRLAIYASDGRRAYRIVDTAFANIIACLRRDPRFRGVSASDLELLLADARASAETQLVRELRDRVHVEDVIGEDL